jgi:hypothetical protein
MDCSELLEPAKILRNQ